MYHIRRTCFCDIEGCLSRPRPPVLYFAVLHLNLGAFLNFPLWSCPPLGHAHWRQRGSQAPEGQEDPEFDSCCWFLLEVPTTLQTAVVVLTLFLSLYLIFCLKIKIKH